MKQRRLAIAALLCALGLAEGLFLILGPRRAGQPAIEDEFVYLFQAKTIASGHLSRPSPPLPEFFEAAHLLVVPRYASKYLPGHALALTPFVAIGIPALAPALECGLFAALLFLLADAAGFSLIAALLAGLLPLVTEPVASIFATYLSWTTALPLIAAALACATVAWRETSAKALALSVSLCGWLFWTRPFAGVAIALTLGVITLARVRRAPSPRRWLLAAIAPVAAWALLTGLVCAQVTGRFFEFPWVTYARQYTPGDGPGFGPPPPAQPEREAPAHLRQMFSTMHALRSAYTLERALAATPARLRTIASFEPTGWLWPLALLGLLLNAGPLLPVLLFGLAFFALQFTFYFPVSLYVLEESVVLVLGLAAAAHFLLARIASLQRPPLRLAATVAASLPAMALVGGAIVSTEDLLHTSRSSPWTLPPAEARLVEATRLAAAEHTRALVFIREPEDADSNLELVYNDPDLERAALVRAHDLGPRDRELQARFPAHKAFLLDVGANTLTPLPSL